MILYICLCSYPPFSDQLAPPCILDQIRACKYTFRPQHWDHISIDAKNLVKGLLTADPESRLTVEQALNHPFMRVNFENQIFFFIEFGFQTLTK